MSPLHNRAFTSIPGVLIAVTEGTLSAMPAKVKAKHGAIAKEVAAGTHASVAARQPLFLFLLLLRKSNSCWARNFTLLVIGRFPARRANSLPVEKLKRKS